MASRVSYAAFTSPTACGKLSSCSLSLFQVLYLNELCGVKIIVTFNHILPYSPWLDVL